MRCCAPVSATPACLTAKPAISFITLLLLCCLPLRPCSAITCTPTNSTQMCAHSSPCVLPRRGLSNRCSSQRITTAVKIFTSPTPKSRRICATRALAASRWRKPCLQHVLDSAVAALPLQLSVHYCLVLLVSLLPQERILQLQLPRTVPVLHRDDRKSSVSCLQYPIALSLLLIWTPSPEKSFRLVLSLKKKKIGC
jgi:hypothetical protein